MKSINCFLRILLVFNNLFFTLFCFAQNNSSEPFLDITESSGFSISAIGDLTKFSKSNSMNFGTKLLFQYNYRSGCTGLNININRGLKFEILPGTVSIVLPDSIKISNKAAISLRPDNFETEIPVSFYSSFNINNFNLSLDANILRRSETNETFQLRHITSNLYYLDFLSKESERIDLLAALSAGYSFSDLTSIKIGVMNIPLFSNNRNSQSDFKIRLFTKISFPFFGGVTNLSSNYTGINLAQSSNLNFISSIFPNRSEISFSYTKLFDKYSYQCLGAGLKFPLLNNLLLSLSYETLLTDGSAFNKDTFSKWKNSMDKSLESTNHFGIKHKTLSLGLNYEFYNTKPPLSLRMINSHILQKSIYSAKREMYSYNTIGTIEIHNFGNHSVKFYLSLEIPDNYGNYKSPEVTIEPDEIKNLPLYLYLNNNIISSTINSQMNIIAYSDGQKINLSTIPIVLFDAHSWDGNTWGLKYYITPEEPSILSQAKIKYLASFDNTDDSEVKRKFNTLKQFITSIGNGINYITDPTSTIYIDRVQYPVETMNEKSGDCEDLTVYLASNLMAVGINCALVDIKAAPKEINFPTAGYEQIGHVFLLIDTGVQPDKSFELGLNELQFVARKSWTGNITIWIPIECTMIGSGFEKAFNIGGQEYYREVVEKEGIKIGTVHIYDQQ